MFKIKILIIALFFSTNIYSNTTQMPSNINNQKLVKINEKTLSNYQKKNEISFTNLITYLLSIFTIGTGIFLAYQNHNLLKNIFSSRQK